MAMHSSPTSSEPSSFGRLLIIDGHSYAYRAFYAIRSLQSPTGAATNAIYGFIRMLGKIRARVQPTHLTVIWDGGLAAERMTLLADYKAQRPEMPSALEEQLDQIVDFLRAASVFSYMKESAEADDCIAAITHQAEAAGMEVVIASSDKDFMQLVSPRVRLLNPHDKGDALWGAEDVKRKTGVEPTQIVDWLSLTGDSVDNIPGVPGIGAKTAANLLTQFQSVEELYRHVEEVRSEVMRGNLRASEELVRRNQQLVRLRSDERCELTLGDLAVKPGDDEALRALFMKWGFRTLLQELEQGRIKAQGFFDQEMSAR
ncbi:MAG TPA: 5'-3' exonuclease H3TH domain-containing protein [Verrucomicrobiae bacterium]|jgi:DNA polymerase-1|nr:5'-3' exonuclease H3TH domain-containing protein [Verrucomicrobiae bacterium]